MGPPHQSSWLVLELLERPSLRPSPSRTRRRELKPRNSGKRGSTPPRISELRVPRLPEAVSPSIKRRSRPRGLPRKLVTSDKESTPSLPERSLSTSRDSHRLILIKENFLLGSYLFNNIEINFQK